MIPAIATVEGKRYRCEARSYSWSLGLGVDIAMFEQKERVAFVRILCPMDSEEYEPLAALQEIERVQLALDRFVQGKLNVTPRSLLQSQQQISSASAASGIAAIITSFVAGPNKRLQPIGRENAPSG